MYVKTLLSTVMCTSLICTSPVNAQSFEKPPTLKASQVLPTKLLKGNGFEVGEQVLNDGYMNTYILKTDYGTLKVRGTYYLVKRITEVEPIRYLDENYGSLTVAAKGVGNTAKGIVTGPVKGAQKLYDHVSDTDKLKKTAKSIPGGIVGIFQVAADGVSAAADFTYETGKSIVSSDTEKRDLQFDKAVTFVEKHTLNYIGYNDAYRSLAKSLKVDPYSLNTILHDEMKRVASVEATVKVGSKFAPGLYSIPGVGDANKYLGYAEKTATYEDPEELEELNQKMLRTLGHDDESKEEKLHLEELLKNASYSPPMRNELAVALKSMEKVTNIDTLINQAAKVKTRTVANFYLQAISKLAEQHKVLTFKHIVPDLLLPAAVSNAGELIVPLPVDHLVWTPEVARIFTYFRKSVLKAGECESAKVLLAGTVSSQCRKELTGLGASEIIEKVKFN